MLELANHCTVKVLLRTSSLASQAHLQTYPQGLDTIPRHVDQTCVNHLFQVHHEWTAPFAIAALYSHPVEHLLTGQVYLDHLVGIARYGQVGLEYLLACSPTSCKRTRLSATDGLSLYFWAICSPAPSLRQPRKRLSSLFQLVVIDQFSAEL